MKTIALLLVVLIGLLVLSHSASPSTQAEAGGYDVSWYVMGGGAGVSAGGDYALSGTAGQAAGGTLEGGDYRLMGGFWPGVSATGLPLYLPLIRR